MSKNSTVGNSSTSDLPVPLFYITDSLASYNAAAVTSHQVGFQIPDFDYYPSGLLRDRQVVISFPPEFDLSGLSAVSYTDTDPGYDARIEWVHVYSNSIVIQFHGEKPGPAYPNYVYLTLFGIKNPFIADHYRIVVQVQNTQTEVVAGPDFSEYFNILAGEAVSLAVFPTGDTTLAVGDGIAFYAAAVDQYGNPLTQEQVTWSLDPNGDNIGRMFGSVLIAQQVGTGRVMAANGEEVAYSGYITVTPGPSSALIVSTEPQTITAGQPLINDVFVQVTDQYGNLAVDFSGPVYFKSDDPGAEIYHDADNPYIFTGSDAGTHLFPAEQFTFFKTGVRMLSACKQDNSICGSTSNITVQPAGLASFNAVLPDEVRAGQPFLLQIVDAVDQFGNPLQGRVEVSGGLIAPDGTGPVLNDINVFTGTGSSNEALYATGENTLHLTFGEISQDVIVDVLPAALGGFDIALNQTQFVGNDFIGNPLVTALDLFDNIKTDFNQTGFDIAITPDKGTILPGLIPSDEFFNGVADVSGYRYNGPPGLIGIEVATLNITPKIAEAVNIYANGIAIKFGLVSTDPITVPQGWHLQLAGDNSNPGNLLPVALRVTPTIGLNKDLNINLEYDDCIPPPFNGGSCPFSVDAELFLDIGFYAFGSIVEADYVIDGNVITVTTNAFKDIQIVAFSELTLENANLPDVGFSADYVFNSIIGFASQNDLPDPAQAFLSLTLVNADTTIKLGAQAVNFSWENELNFNIDASFKDGIPVGKYQYRASLNIGFLIISGNLNYHREFFLPDSITIYQPAEISLDESSISPATINVGLPQRFTFNLGAQFQAPVIIDGITTKLTITDGNSTSTGRMAEDEYNLTAKNYAITTVPIDIPTSWEGKSLTAVLNLVGVEGGVKPLNDTIQFDFPVTALPEAKIKIVSLEVAAPNTPFVNTGQLFQLKGKIFNQSETAFAGPITVSAYSDGSSNIGAAQIVDVIPANETTFVSITVTAAGQPDAAEQFSLKLSIDTLGIVAPVDNTAVAVIQTPPALVIDAVVSGHPGSAVLLNLGEEIIVTGKIVNNGQGGYTNGDLLIDATGGIEILGEVDATDSTVSWRLKTPDNIADGDITISFAEGITDKNTGLEVANLGAPAVIDYSSRAAVTILKVGSENVSTRPLVRGVESSLFDLVLENATSDDRNVIGLSAIRVETVDKNGAPFSPDALMEAGDAGFYLDGALVSRELFINDKAVYLFDDFNIAADSVVKLQYRLVPLANTSLQYFSLRIDSDSILALFTAGPLTGQKVPVSGQLNQNFAVNVPQAIIPENLGESFKNYPNPFNPDRESTELRYYLDTDSDVDIMIYTVTGEKVREIHLSSGGNGGMAGANSGIYWDGTNGDGEKVLNGVYIALIKVAAGGATAKVKIAVVK